MTASLPWPASDREQPSTPDGHGPAAGARLLLIADELLQLAAMLRSTIDVLPAFDRADVWQGGRATEFRAGLDDQRRLLIGAADSAVTQLEESARRAQLRAQSLPSPDPVAERNGA